mgnify:CR=1 FL=1
MSNLTYEQIENLRREGYEIVERGGKTDIVKETPSGTVRYKMENGVVQQVDSYFGDVRNTEEHDRVSLDLNSGKMTGHGFNHKKW